MDEETERILDEIIQHRNKATELLLQSIKLREEAKDYATLAEKTLVLEKSATLSSEASVENEKANTLTNELLQARAEGISN